MKSNIFLGTTVNIMEEQVGVKRLDLWQTYISYVKDSIPNEFPSTLLSFKSICFECTFTSSESMPKK